MDRMTPPTDRDLIRTLLSDQDTEDLIRYWMQQLTDWLKSNPASKFIHPEREDET